MLRTAVSALLFLVLWLVPVGPVLAEKPTSSIELSRIVFWGIQSECEYDIEVSSAVEKRLVSMGEPLISIPAIAAALPARHPGCIGEDCVTPVEDECPGSKAYILGGTITQRHVGPSGGETGRWHLIRIWRIEAGSKKAAYIQHACRNCDLTVVVPNLVAEIVEYPPNSLINAADVRTAKMPFCKVDSSDEAPLPREQKIAVLVSGAKDSKTGKALLRALKDHVEQTGKKVVRDEVLKSSDEPSSLPPPELAQFVAKRTVNDVLSIELLAEGQVRVRLMNGGTLTTAESSLDCLGCNAESLERRSIIAVGTLLDRCTETGCRAEAPMPWPDGLCQANRGPICSHSDIDPDAPPAAPAVRSLCKKLFSRCKTDAPRTRLPPTSPRLGTGRIVGASLLGGAGVGAIITAGVLTSYSGQPAGDGCTSQNGLFNGACSYPILTTAYVPTYVAGAILLGGALLNLYPLFKSKPDALVKQREIENREAMSCP